MKESINELKKKNSELTNSWSKLTDAHQAVFELTPILGKVKVKELLREIKPAQKKAEQEVRKVRKSIDKMQTECEHGNWIYLGHDSHYNHEECGHCGYIDYKA